MEHRRLIGANARGEEHVAELRTRRIGDDPLDIVLGETDRRREQRGDRADDGDDRARDRGVLEQRRQEANHVHACGHHGGGVDQGRDRRRSFHRIRKPGVQEELSRLAHRADEEKAARQIQRAPVLSKKRPGRPGLCRDQREQLREPDRVEHPEDRHDTEREAEVSHPVDDESLDRRCRGSVLLEPESDEQVTGEADAFPAEEELHEVRRRHQHQHGEGEQGQIGKEARLRRIIRHVAPAVEVHESGYGRDDDQHHRRQAVETDRPGGLEVADLDERRNVHSQRRRGAGPKAQEHVPGQDAAEK